MYESRHVSSKSMISSRGTNTCCHLVTQDISSSETVHLSEPTLKRTIEIRRGDVYTTPVMVVPVIGIVPSIGVTHICGEYIFVYMYIGPSNTVESHVDVYIERGPFSLTKMSDFSTENFSGTRVAPSRSTVTLPLDTSLLKIAGYRI